MTIPLQRRTLLRATVGAASVAIAGEAILAQAAHAASPFPWIIDCDSWGANPPTSDVVLSQGTTRKILIHHTAYPNTTDHSREQAIWLAKDIQRLHQQVNGWADSGQHFTVSRGGYVLEGRHRSLETLESGAAQVVSAHCPGQNTASIGIENEGTYIEETPPQALWDSLVKLCVTVSQQYNVKAHHIFGHWDFRATLCPGAAFYRQFPELRRQVARELGTQIGDIPARTWPDIYSSIGGPVVRVAQWLLRFRGYDIAVTGAWSAAMTAAVQDWQTRNGLPPQVDGRITDATWDCLVPELGKDAVPGDAVSALQQAIAHKGYPNVSLTGVYDHPTKKAVQDLQLLHGLDANGKLTVTGWCAMTGGVVRESFAA